MKKYVPIVIGLLLLSALAPEKTSAIYGLAREITNQEFNPDGYVDQEVAAFIGFQEVFRMPEHELSIGLDDVSNALRYRPDLICGKRNQSVPCNIAEPVRSVARRESFSRIVGRDLYLTAFANELPLTDHTGQEIMIAPRLPSIVRMWQSSFDWMFTPVKERRIRSHSLPKGLKDEEGEVQVDPEVKKFGCNIYGRPGDFKCGNKGIVYLLEQEDEPARSGIFSRYRWGLRTILREDSRFSDCKEWETAWNTRIYDGSELILLKKRHCKIEGLMKENLKILRDKLMEEISMGEMEPLARGETVIYPIVEIRSGFVSFKGGPFLWFRLKDNSEHDDVGFDKEKPYNNVFLPQFTCEWKKSSRIVPACVHGTDGDVVLGGMYPEPPLEPPEGEKLCSMTFSSKGYLCDPIESRECPSEREEGEEGEEEGETGSATDTCEGECIELATCKPGGISTDTVVMLSESGPDACRLGGWRLDEATLGGKPVNDTIKRDPEISGPYDCGNCSVDFYCDGKGVRGPNFELDPEGDIDGYQNCREEPATYPKNKGTGVIPICIPNTHPFNAYNTLHELVHAQQMCNLPPEQKLWEDTQSCCTKEIQANLIVCSAMEHDGLFEETQITTETCMGILSNHQCQHLVSEDAEDEDAIACIGSTFGDKGDVEKLYNEIRSKVAPTAIPCSKAIGDLSDQAKGLLNSLRLVCQPECDTKYVSTIGNNACYIAQCVEESLETQRILPGRMTEISPEQTFPWDDATKTDPMIGSLMTYPPLPYTRFPKYRPALLAKELDLALCQLNGLPIKNPPHECNFNILRQLSLKPEYPVLLGAGLINQNSELFSSAWSLQTMAPSVGSRIAVRLYQEYFSRAGRAFEEVMRSANMLVGGIANTEFPENMCPRYGNP